MPRMIDLTGQRFGRLLVVREAERVRTSGGTSVRRWVCVCDCGAQTAVRAGALGAGNTRSCGCAPRGAKNKHGEAAIRTPEYVAWESMLNRCRNPKAQEWKRYGGRGVKVCSEWDPQQGGGYAQFLADMGRRPSPEHSLDKDVRGGVGCLVYSAETCCWATRAEQQNSTRQTVRVVVDGVEMGLSEAARLAGVLPDTAHGRLESGRTMEEVLSPERLAPRRGKMVVVELEGERVSFTEAARRLGVPLSTAAARTRRGMTLAAALGLN
jgi:hypothetical protein